MLYLLLIYFLSLLNCSVLFYSAYKLLISLLFGFCSIPHIYLLFWSIIRCESTSGGRLLLSTFNRGREALVDQLLFSKVHPVVNAKMIKLWCKWHKLLFAKIINITKPEQRAICFIVANLQNQLILQDFEKIPSNKITS